MRFNRKELTAILKMANSMVMADGGVDEKEVHVITHELLRFNVPQDHIEPLLRESSVMDASEAFAILASLDVERKKYVSSYLGTIMAADGDIDDKEMALWRLVSTLCGFPTMTVVDAMSNMAGL